MPDFGFDVDSRTESAYHHDPGSSFESDSYLNERDEPPLAAYHSEPEVTGVDTDGDGDVDRILHDRDGDGRIDMIVSDTNDDGAPDHLIADLDFDGRADFVARDTNFDGEFDLFAYDRDGDGDIDYS